MSDTCICICSCDTYSDIWPFFFSFLRSAWGTCPYPIYLNTEKKSYCDEFFKVNVINCKDESTTWSGRLIACLKQLNYKNVIIILDDFFLLSKVDTTEIQWCEKKLEENKKIACFGFRNNTGNNDEHNTLGDYVQRKDNEYYIVNLLPAIWNRKVLLKILSPYENAWQLEWFGTERAKLTKYLFYELRQTAKPVFDFNISPKDGYGLCQGKWTKNNVELFESKGLRVDFSIRGFCDPTKISTIVTVPRRTTRDKATYFLYGGLPYGVYHKGILRMPFYEQVKMLIKHPRYYSIIMRNKLRYVFGCEYGKSIDTRY